MSRSLNMKRIASSKVRVVKPRERTVVGSLLVAAMCLGVSPAALAQTHGLRPDASPTPSRGLIIVGAVEALKIDNLDPSTNTFSSGVILVGGQLVTIPANLVIEFPANFMPLDELFAQAPPSCLARGESGLALADGCLAPGNGPVASMLCNRMPDGEVIVGDMFIERGQEAVAGNVSFINYDDGYFRINGLPGSDTTGVMIRLNDPETRHTIQSGAGCGGDGAINPNCSPDIRFTNDPDNYTFVSTTGYPMCIPSTDSSTGSRTVGSDASGVGDPFCPDTNRGTPLAFVDDSSRYAPLKIGDSISASGNYEIVDGVRFLSCYSINMLEALVTAPGEVDYIIFEEVEWDAPGFANERLKNLMIGFGTIEDTQVDIFKLQTNPATGEYVELPFASTVGNPLTVNQGIPPFPGHAFKINHDSDFFLGAPVNARRSPCQLLKNAGFLTPCDPSLIFPIQDTIATEVATGIPITRELIGRSRNKLANPLLEAFDITGTSAQWGEYLNPVGIGHPEFGEIDLNGIATPFIFAGLTWNLNRCLFPPGWGPECADLIARPLSPFPFSQLDPRTQAGAPIGQPGSPGIPTGLAFGNTVSVRDRVLSYYDPAESGGAGVAANINQLLAWPPEPFTDPGDDPAFAASLGAPLLQITRASHKTDAAGTFVDVWATADAGSSLEVSGPGLPAATPMAADGTSYFAHVVVADAVAFDASKSATVTDTGSLISRSSDVADEVFIGTEPSVIFDPITFDLAVKGASSSVGTPASLSSGIGTGIPVDGAGEINVVIGSGVPPLAVMIDSPLQGTLTLPVSVSGCEALSACAASASAAVCEWCVFDHNQNGFTDGLDFAFFSGCFGACYVAGDPCAAANYDGDALNCVGGGDFGAFSGCFSLDCDGCPDSLCFGSTVVTASAAIDQDTPPEAAVHLVAVGTPSESDFAYILPESSKSFGVKETFFVEVWASRASELNDAEYGLASVFVDVSHDDSVVTALSAEPSKTFATLSRVSADRGSVGGVAPIGDGTMGIQHDWVRVATLKMRGVGQGIAQIGVGSSEAPFGVSVFGKLGDLDPALIDFVGLNVNIRHILHPAGNAKSVTHDSGRR